MAFVSLTETCLSQDKIPTSVMSAFNSKFPNAINVKWDKENEHEYEASFEWESKKLSANYSDTGEWLETESTILFYHTCPFQTICINTHCTFASYIC